LNLSFYYEETKTQIYHIQLFQINTSTHHHIITSTHQHIITSSHHHIITSTHHQIITSTHQHIITSTHQHIITSTHQQQLLPEELQSQAGSVPRRTPLIIPAAHPTPDFTVMAPSGQFFEHAPHSMQWSRLRMTAFLFSISNTA